MTDEISYFELFNTSDRVKFPPGLWTVVNFVYVKKTFATNYECLVGGFDWMHVEIQTQYGVHQNHAQCLCVDDDGVKKDMPVAFLHEGYSSKFRSIIMPTIAGKKHHPRCVSHKSVPVLQMSKHSLKDWLLRLSDVFEAGFFRSHFWWISHLSAFQYGNFSAAFRIHCAQCMRIISILEIRQKFYFTVKMNGCFFCCTPENETSHYKK